MSSVRRWYIYLVSAISLQAVVWAIIALLRNLLLQRLQPPPTAIAFEIAVIVIGLPVFLVHWLWAQRLAERVEEERGATLRRFYLYGTMAGFLGPFAANVFDLIGTTLQVESTLDRRPDRLTSGDAIVYHLLALLILGALWFYHQRIVASDSTALAETDGSATVRRLYILGFSAAGLTLTTMAIIYLFRWITLQFGGDVIGGRSLQVGLTTEVTRLIVGVPLWLIFWRWAQRLFDGPDEAERESTLRKFYLYGAVLVGALGAVANGTIILASVFRSTLALPSEGDIRGPLPIIVGMGILWAYHAYLVRKDAEQAGEAPRQAGVRRLYLYLIAAVGLTALLIGLGGDVSVTIRSLGEGFGSELREQLAWFTAAIIAGLPVWILPWRQAQTRAAGPGPAGTDARRSIVRRIYVYLFLFIATMTVLSGAVFILFKVLSWLLGSDAPTLNELGQAIAFGLIAVGVWLYHGAMLRGDHVLSDREQVRQLEDMRIVVLDMGDGRLGRAVVDALKRDRPELDLQPTVLASLGTAALGTDAERQEIVARLARAELIVGPWAIALPGRAGDAASQEIVRAVVDSPARKLLVPTRFGDWEWAGVDRWDTQAIAQQTARAIVQIAAGDVVKPARPLGAGTIIAIIIGVLILMSSLTSLVASFFSF